MIVLTSDFVYDIVYTECDLLHGVYNMCVSHVAHSALVSLTQMISAEVPILFSKAASIFIRELTLRAWIQTEEAKRRTLQV